MHLKHQISPRPRIRAEDAEITLKWGETDDLLPMNPEGVEVDVPQGGRNDYVR